MKKQTLKKGLYACSHTSAHVCFMKTACCNQHLFYSSFPILSLKNGQRNIWTSNSSISSFIHKSITCRKAGLKKGMQPVFIGLNIQPTVSFKFAIKSYFGYGIAAHNDQKSTSVLKGLLSWWPSTLLKMRYIFLYEQGSVLFESNLLEIVSNICLIIMFYLNKLASLSEMVLTAGQEAFDLLCNYSQLTLGSLHYSELNLWHCVVQKKERNCVH